MNSFVIFPKLDMNDHFTRNSTVELFRNPETYPGISDRSSILKSRSRDRVEDWRISRSVDLNCGTCAWCLLKEEPIEEEEEEKEETETETRGEKKKRKKERGSRPPSR